MEAEVSLEELIAISLLTFLISRQLIYGLSNHINDQKESLGSFLPVSILL